MSRAPLHLAATPRVRVELDRGGVQYAFAVHEDGHLERAPRIFRATCPFCGVIGYGFGVDVASEKADSHARSGIIAHARPECGRAIAPLTPRDPALVHVPLI